MRRTALLPLAAALVIAACSAGGPSGNASPAATLEGRTFLSTRVEGRVLVPGTQIRLSFERGNVGGTAGCNSFGGRYRVDGGRLLVAEMHQTEMACDAPLMVQEEWVMRLLANGAAITLDGDTLVLAGDGVVLTLTDRVVADPDRPLEGTRWVVDSLVLGDAVSSVPAGVTAALRFVDGRLELEAGCNQGGGEYRVEDGVITFGPIALTKMACDDARAGVERHVTQVLDGRVGYEIEAGTLRLGGANGPGLVLRAEG